MCRCTCLKGEQIYRGAEWIWLDKQAYCCILLISMRKFSGEDFIVTNQQAGKNIVISVVVVLVLSTCGSAPP